MQKKTLPLAMSEAVINFFTKYEIIYVHSTSQRLEGCVL